MNKIAKFHKVDFEQFLSDWTETFENFDSQSTENIEALRKMLLVILYIPTIYAHPFSAQYFS